jgi:hypothetical protein
MNSSDGTWTPKPAKVKNLWITARCLICKQVKAYSGLILLGDIADTDPDAVPVPEMCSCGPVSFDVTLNQGMFPVHLQSSADKEHEFLQRALRLVLAIAACDGYQDNQMTFCNPTHQEHLARQLVTDAQAILHEAGWL